MPFDPTSAPSLDLTSLAWALWRARDASGDTASTPVLADAQWEARLTEGAWTRAVDAVDTTHYRPLEAAARFVIETGVSESRIGDVTTKYASPEARAGELRRQQAELDKLIPADTTRAGDSLEVAW
jgi:hypothetical protein